MLKKLFPQPTAAHQGRESNTQTQQIPKLYPSGFTVPGTGLRLGLYFQYNQGISIRQHMN